MIVLQDLQLEALVVTSQAEIVGLRKAAQTYWDRPDTGV